MTEAMKLLKQEFGEKVLDKAVERVAGLPVEVPSWGFGRAGTRFEVYASGNEPSTVEERIASAGRFARLTGKGKTVALHFPWDGRTKKDVEALKPMLDEAGVKAGAVNANLFSMRDQGPLDARLRFGSLTHPEKEVREAAIQHCLDCVEYMHLLGSDILVLWLPDGTNSPGQMSLYDQASRLEESLRAVHRGINRDEKLLVEYKIFEPAVYSTAIQDYARSTDLCALLGDNAFVLVDLGHHAHAVNVEQIVANTLRNRKLGGFHFNDRAYADDDLATGSLHPHQLFRIFVNLVEGELKGYTPVNELALMIDQSHCVKDPLEELVESLENIETAYAKSLLVDYDALKRAQDACDPTEGDRILRKSFLADVRPLLAEARNLNGVPEDPLAAARKQ